MTPDERQRMRSAVEDAGLASADLDEEDMEKLWVAKYRTACRLRAATRAGLVEAGLAPGVVDAILMALGAGEADVQATIKARAPCSAKYAAHLLAPTSPPHKEAATVVGPHHVATYAHQRHSTWEIGQKMQVAVHCPQEDRRLFVDAVVVYKDLTKDIVILEVQRDLSPPVLDCKISPGDMYYTHGQSTQAQADATSISHGMVAATELDAQCHIRGDTLSGAGDSGGGCFSVASGKLIAMVVGSQAETNKAVLVPITTVANILMEISASKALGAAV